MLRCRDGSLYTGITTDLRRRIAAHRAGKGSRYTRSRLPVRLVYRERPATLGGALKREAAIKRLSSTAKRPPVRKAEGGGSCDRGVWPGAGGGRAVRRGFGASGAGER